MKFNKFGRAMFVVVAAAAGFIASASAVSAATISFLGLTDSNALISFDLDDLTKTRQIGVSGVDGTLLGIDFRPANNLLYGVTDTNKIYTINPVTGAATLQSTLSPLSFNGGQLSGLDFNPAADRLRLVGSNDQNFRINVDTGAIADFDAVTPGVQPDGTLIYAAGDVNAGADPNITAAGYTNSFLGAPAGRSTQLYDIDYVLDTLVLQSPPNDGTLNTVGALGFDFDEKGGFDIFSPSADSNTAYATSGGLLYTIDLATGQATSQGAIGSGDTRLIGLATTSVPEPASVLALCGLGLVVFSRRRQTNARSSYRNA
ncbi:MAG: DUF4394 domain-containing protein [Leptolyngbya sp. SIO4C1]|nr:DUF4394 domain-containing protein [Leptolyngbya sp. SIO4C1]